MIDDGELVRRAQQGDRGALDSLLRRHYDRLHALCRRIIGDDADALDACQEALISLARGLPRFDGRSSFATWAHRVATNCALDELRRRQRRPQPGLAEATGARAPAAANLAIPANDEGAERVAARLDVDAALARLPADYRVAVVLRDLCDLSYAEIAEVLGVPPGTVRSRIARGRTALAPLLVEQPTRNHLPPGRRPTR